jgi:Spy/CpxP family protein refolding chaperone
MKKHATAILLGLALAGAVGMSATAADRADRGPPDGGRDMVMPGMMGSHGMERFGQKLGLSAEQQASLKAIMDAARPEMDSIRADMKSNRETLRNADPGDPTYATTVANARNVAADVAGRMVTATSQVRANVWAVLTPEQRIKAKAMQAERSQQMGERRKQRGGRDREM